MGNISGLIVTLILSIEEKTSKGKYKVGELTNDKSGVSVTVVILT